MPDEIRMWFWMVPATTYPFKRRKSTWRMTEEDARARYGDAAEKVEGSLEIRTDQGQTSAFFTSVPRRLDGR